MDWARSTVVIFFLLAFDAGYAQDSVATYSELEVKAAVEEIGVLNICPDRALLELAELEVENCRKRLSTLAAVCWHIIDPVVSEYNIQKGDEKKEIGKGQLVSLSLVYSSCIRSEILRGILKKLRDANSK